MNNSDNLLLLFITAVGVVSLANTILIARRAPTATRHEGRNVIIDTCALIDGRIIEVAKAGFIPSQLMVPRAVVRELQYLADQQDATKRERGRFGLDVINELQQLRTVEVRIIQHEDTETGLVDEALIAVAKLHGAQLYTTDYNLNKVAQVEGVEVLNVNELAQALRPHFLPGEKAYVKLVQEGQGQNQAVGYLDDGTMIVVEQGRKLLGKQVHVVFTRVLQTQAGKMMFATLDSAVSSGGKRRTTTPVSNASHRR